MQPHAGGSVAPGSYHANLLGTLLVISNHFRRVASLQESEVLVIPSKRQAALKEAEAAAEQLKRVQALQPKALR